MSNETMMLDFLPKVKVCALFLIKAVKQNFSVNGTVNTLRKFLFYFNNIHKLRGTLYYN